MHELTVVVAKYVIALPVLLALVVWAQLNRRQKIEFIILAVVAAIIAVGLAKIGGKLYYDPRPFVAGHFTPYFQHSADNGFPSDHTLFGSLLAFLTLKYSRSVGIAALLLAILVGVARVIAGVHHGIDIIGAVIFSLIGFGVAALLVPIITARFARPESANER